MCCGSCAKNWRDNRAFGTLRELPVPGEMINFLCLLAAVMGLLALNSLKLAELGLVPQLWSRTLMSLDAALSPPEWSIPFLPSCLLLRAECVASLAHVAVPGCPPQYEQRQGMVCSRARTPGSHGYSAGAGLVQLWAAGVLGRHCGGCTGATSASVNNL